MRLKETKIILKQNSHGDKNMKPNGFQVRINIISKYQQIVLLILYVRNQEN